METVSSFIDITLGLSALIVATLAICVTAFVFVSNILDTRSKEHPEEEDVCLNYQRESAAVLMRWTIISIVVVLCNVIALFEFPCIRSWYWWLKWIDIVLCLVVLSRLIIYCIGLVNYQKGLADKFLYDFSEVIKEWSNSGQRKGQSSRCIDLNEATFSVENYIGSIDSICKGIVGSDVTDYSEIAAKIANKRDGIVPGSHPGENLACQIKCMYQVRQLNDVFKRLESNQAHMKRPPFAMIKFRCWKTKEKKKQIFGFCTRRELASLVSNENRLKAVLPLLENLWLELISKSERNGFSLLNGCHFFGVNLAKIDFENSSFAQTKFDQCNFLQVGMIDCSLRGTLFTECLFRETAIKQPLMANTSFISCDLSGLRWSNCNRDESFVSSKEQHMRILSDTLNDIVFLESSFMGASFKGNEIQKGEIKNTSFEKSLFRRSIFAHVVLDNSMFVGVNAAGSSFQCAEGQSLDFSESRFFDSHFDSCHFEYAYCHSGSFVNSVVEDSTFINSVFTKARFNRSKLKKTSFENCHLEATSFANAEIIRCKMNKAEGRDLSFTNSTVRGTNIAEGVLPSLTAMDANMTNCSFSMMESEHSVWNGTHFVDCVFDKAKLNQSEYRNCTFERCSFNGTSFLETDFTGSQFVGCGFKKADLRKAVFVSAVFSSDSKIEDSSLSGASFLNAHFQNVTIHGSHSFFSAESLDGVVIECTRIEYDGDGFDLDSFRHIQSATCSTFNDRGIS